MHIQVNNNGEEEGFDSFDLEVEKDIDSAATPFRPHHFKTEVEMKTPVIYVGYKAYNDMYMLVDICDIEIGWMGIVDVMPNGHDLRISRIMLPKQECSSATTNLEAEALGEIGQALLKQPSGTELYNKLRFWGHSHVSMDVGPSGQDNDQMEMFKENGCDYFVRGIMNKRGKMKFDVFYYERQTVILDVPWTIYFPIDGKKRKFWEDQIKNKVERISYSFASRPAVDFGPSSVRNTGGLDTNFKDGEYPKTEPTDLMHTSSSLEKKYGVRKP